jgi:hypothetical protein
VNAADDLAMVGRVILSLAAVMLLAMGAARIARRTGAGTGAGIRVLGRVGLTREAGLAVVEVGGVAMVLGVTAHQVSLLTTMDAATPAPPPEAGGGPVLPTVAAPLAGRPARRGAGSGSPLDPRTWRQGVEALRDLTARR